MPTLNELLRELHRLNKTGIINDEEFLILRKIIASGRVSPEIYRRFDQLFAGDPKHIPVGTEQKTRLTRTDKKSAKNDERLYSLAEASNELNLKLGSAGMFDNSRPLLSCPACQLFEAVTIEGRLIVAERIDPKIDTGLRFARIGDTEWECPDCGNIFGEKREKIEK